MAKVRKVPDEGWVMQDGTPWPGNNTNDHPGMIQVGWSDPRASFSFPMFCTVPESNWGSLRCHNWIGKRAESGFQISDETVAGIMYEVFIHLEF